MGHNTILRRLIYQLKSNCMTIGYVVPEIRRYQQNFPELPNFSFPKNHTITDIKKKISLIGLDILK